MKKLIKALTFLSLCCICFISCTNQEEIKQKDHELQARLDSLPFDGTITISRTTHRYLLQRFDEQYIKIMEGKMKFGEKSYNIVREGDKYTLKNPNMDFYFKITKNKMGITPTGEVAPTLVIKKVKNLNEEEINQKDSALQVIIDKLSNKPINLSQKEYQYFLERFIQDSIKENNGMVKFGKNYFILIENPDDSTQYALEDPRPGIDSCGDDHFYFRLTKRFAEDSLTIMKVKDFHENE